MNVKRGEWMANGAGRSWATVVVMLLCIAAPALTGAQNSHPSAAAQHVSTQHLPPTITTYVRSTKCQPVTIDISLQQHEMPDVTGCTYDEVVNSFREFGGGAPQREERFSGAPVGQIVEQVPDLKNRLPRDEPIVLTVSKGPQPPPPPPPPPPPATNATSETSGTSGTSGTPASSASENPPIGVHSVPLVAVPDVIGSSESDAQNSMAQSHLRAISQGHEPSLIPRGKVTRTEPQAPTPVHSDTGVDYWVASGSNVVPDLVGQSVEQSQTLLAGAGFRPGAVTYRNTPGIAGLVLGQDPRANTVAPLDSSVAMTVTQPVNVTVPSVMDMPLEQAMSTLGEAGLASGRVVREFHLSRNGRVFRQDPLPGAIVAKSAEVSMWVSSVAAIVALVAGLSVGLAGIAGWLWHMSRQRLIKVTQRMLRIKPSLASDNESQVTLAVPMAGPTTALRARLEMGEVRFEGPVPIERQETNHD